MKMQKYTAPDMRTALRKVRAEHGPDALILWTRRAAGVVELTVATDAEAAAHAGNLAPGKRVVGGEPLGPVQASTPQAMPTVVVPSAVVPPPLEPTATVLELPMPAPDATAPAFSSPMSPVAPVSAAAEKASAAIDGELKALRRLLETQLAALAWNDLTRRSPVTAELIREFAALGIERDLAADVLATAPTAEDLAVARRHAHAALRDRIGVVEDRWTEHGGTLAIVGPAGSGKTSALAAIAARWVLRHGPAGAALVSAGDSRFGAFEHLARLGRLLGVPTYQVDEIGGVPELLARLGGQRLVLVDTPAMRGEELDAAAPAMAALREVCTLAVTLPATMQATALRLTAARHARIGATVAIATRLDEAASLGGLLSASIGAGLPFAYVTDGTRLPDDLRPARAEDLVALAASLVERNGTAADEELLVCRAEGRAHVAS